MIRTGLTMGNNVGAWETVRGELAVASGKEFERRVAPILRLFQSDVIPTPEMQHLDRAGIDFITWSDEGPLPWVVQCKGFKEQELGSSQVEQILESIDKFRKSEWTCEEYAILHNRESKNREAVHVIEESLARLREEKKAVVTRLWDRQSFISDARKRLRDIFVERMRDDAARLLAKQEGLFRFGSVYVPDVPVTERRLIIKRDEEVRMEPADAASARRRAADLVLSKQGKARWTLLTGHFGTGKTTTGLRAARWAGRDVIYVRGDDLIDRTGGIGTNILLSKIVDCLGLFDDYDDETRAFLNRIAGRSMAELLRTTEGASFALFIDALDESRTYSTPEGVGRLINQVIELRCPVILTTRREHFDSTFRNFDAALRREVVPVRGGPSRDGRLIDIDLWGDKEINALLAQAIRAAFPDEAENLKRLSAALRSGEARRLYGDLPTHPLFLQMILEEAASGRIEKRSRAQLVQDWMERKIERDLGATGRATPVEMVEISALVEGMMRVHERVARRMATFEDGAWRLVEHVMSDVIEKEAREVFRQQTVDISTILTCSVLSAVTPRRRGVMPIKFLLRVCQEFFIAAELRRSEEAADKWPPEVVRFWKELGDSNGGDARTSA